MKEIIFYKEKIILIDRIISNLVNEVTESLCIELDSQNILDSDILKEEIKIINEYIQWLFKNNFSEMEYILDQRENYLESGVASKLLYRRINNEINKLLNNYSDIEYYIILDRISFINRLLCFKKSKKNIKKIH